MLVIFFLNATLNYLRYILLNILLYQCIADEQWLSNNSFYVNGILYLCGNSLLHLWYFFSYLICRLKIIANILILHHHFLFFYTLLLALFGRSPGKKWVYYSMTIMIYFMIQLFFRFFFLGGAECELSYLLDYLWITHDVFLPSHLRIYIFGSFVIFPLSSCQDWSSQRLSITS